MIAIRIRYTSHFARAYKKLPEDEKRLAEEREAMFRKNPFDRKLDTHKLKGKLKDKWSFSLTRSQRVLFGFLSENEVVFYDIGSHQIYQA